MIRNNGKGLTIKIVFNLICWAISISCIFPIIWLFYSALKTNEEFRMDTLKLPEIPQFNNFVNAFKIGNMHTAMGNSIFYALINVALVCILAFVTAYFVARYSFKGKKLIYYTYLFGMLVPLYALLVPVFVQFKLLSLINRRISLIIIYYAIAMPLAIFLYESFIKGIPIEIDEASTVDGCTMFQRLFWVIFPLCRPMMATVAILTMLQTWNEFGFCVLLTPKHNLHTLMIAVRSFESGHYINFPYMMAGLATASLPILIAYSIFSKQVVKGMTAGAVKG